MVEIGGNSMSATVADTRNRTGAMGATGRRSWPLERVLFLMAGTMTGVSALLAALVSPWFLLLTGFVAVNQLAFVTLGNCPSSWVLRRYLGFRSASER
jgi:hypothetical protein